MVNAELCEGALIEKGKKYVDEYNATTACTLRVTEPYHNEGRVIIGDAWFGSLRTVAALKERNTYAIMNLKLQGARFPKK